MPKALTCWTERTKLEKWLIPSLILIGALAIALILTCFYLAGWFTKSATTPVINEDDKKGALEKKTERILIINDDNDCKTPSCLYAAKTMLENMDPTILPCESFYDFACGNFLKNAIIPEDREEISTFGIIEEKMKEEMKIVLEEPIQKGEPKAFQLMKKYYKTCMDTDAIEKHGMDTILSVLKDFGGWPLLEGDNWVESKFDWKELSHKFLNIGFVNNPLFQVYVDIHLKNSTRRIIYITDKGERLRVSFRKRLWTEEEGRKAYFQYMVDATSLLGVDKNKSIKEIKDMFDFHVKLQDLPILDRGAAEEMSLNQLQHKIPNISWVEYINTLLAPYVKISGDEVVFIFEMGYLKGLGSLLPTVSKRTMANYLMWNFVSSFASYSTKALREAEFKYTKVTTGIATQSARWVVCVKNYMSGTTVGVVSESLYIGAGALFVRKYFTNKTKQAAKEMVLNIHHSLEDTMKNIDWMDAKTKKGALEKLKAMSFTVAYPDEFLDDKKLEEFFGDLDLAENNYIKSYLKLQQFDLRNHYSRLRVPIIRNNWISIGVTSINAANDLTQNTIEISATFLRDLMFDINRPHYLNYGGIGIVIGHEMTHGFDTTGRKRDKYGNEFEWWAPETKKLFLNKSQCFIDQYNKYLVPGLNVTVDGNITVAETIADNGGVAVSYKAYQELIRKQGADQTLPGLNYTQNQLFWLAIANTGCSKSRIETQEASLGDEHPPDRVRITGSLSNNKDFSKDFNCPSESKMNPKHKCKLW